jgi:hypothetical protein
MFQTDLTIDFGSFSWMRPVSRRKGFRWAGDTLVPPDASALRPYTPDSGIFRQFGDLKTPAEIIAFANLHGSLTSNPALDDWPLRIKEMHEAVDLHESLKARNWKRLRQILPRAGASPAHLTSAAVVQLWHLSQHVTRHLQPTGHLDGTTVTLRLGYQSLLDFMWFSFARSVVGGVDYVKCASCPRYILLQTGFNRSDRTTCGATCRYRLYKQRMAQARELHAAGKTARQIAKELPAKLDHVKKWISQPNKGE